MRNFLSFTICSLIAISNFSCINSKTSSPPPDSQTQEFSTYLKNNFDDSISHPHHLYILISKKDSRENISSILKKISHKLSGKQSDTYSTIISSGIPLPDSLLPPGKILTDWDCAIDKLKLPLTGVTLIQTSENKLTDLLPLTMENADNENGFIEW